MRATTKIALLLGALALSGTACTKPDPTVAHNEAGQEAINNGEWDKAVAEFDQSLAINPKQEKAWEKKAYAHMQANQLDKMEEALSKEADLRTEPAKKAECYRNIAGVYMGKTQSDKAEPWFNKAVDADPNDDQSLQWLGEIYSQRGGARDMKAAVVPEKLEKALGYYDRLIKVTPANSPAYLNKRIAVNRLRDYEVQQQQLAEAALTAAGKDADKVAAAQADVDKHKARAEELKKSFDELSKKLTELAKNPPPAAAPPK